MKTLLKGIIIGIVITVAVFLLSPTIFKRAQKESSLPLDKQITTPLLGEKGYNPETAGYQALIGIVKEVGTDEIIFTSTWCLKQGCDATKEYEYRATITPKTILKRLIQKSKKEFELEIAARKKGDPPSNPLKEASLDLASIKTGEDIRVLIEKIINNSSVIAHEVSIFQPVPSPQTP